MLQNSASDVVRTDPCPLGKSHDPLYVRNLVSSCKHTTLSVFVYTCAPRDLHGRDLRIHYGGVSVLLLIFCFEFCVFHP